MSAMNMLICLKTASLLTLGGIMNPKDFAKIIRQAEKQVPIEMRAHYRLLELQAQMEVLIGNRKRKEDWLELRRLAGCGKRIAIRFGDHEMRRYFGVIFNTASTYLELPGDRDQRGETYALT